MLKNCLPPQQRKAGIVVDQISAWLRFLHRGPYQRHWRLAAGYAGSTDQSEIPIRVAPPRPVMTSGIWNMVCTYMMTDRIRIA